MPTRAFKSYVIKVTDKSSKAVNFSIQEKIIFCEANTNT